MNADTELVPTKGSATGATRARPSAIPARATVDWCLRRLMFERDMFKTSDIQQPLRDHGIELSREQVYRLVTRPPVRLSMEVLAALCSILECGPSDLIRVEAAPAPPAVRRGTPDKNRSLPQPAAPASMSPVGDITPIRFEVPPGT